MPEDDFDIYGEDDGFATSKDVTEQVGRTLPRVHGHLFANVGDLCVRACAHKDDGFQDEVQVEEPVEAVSTHVEPSTGEKRPRLDEDDETRQNATSNEPTSSRAHSVSGNPVTHPVPVILTKSSDATATGGDVAMNGSYHAGSGHGGGGGNVDPSMMGYDALYIGDLQWVRFSLILSFSFSHALCFMPYFDFTVDDRRGLASSGSERRGCD